jgi:hypothetical protein
MANRIKTQAYVNVIQILFYTDPQVSVGVLVSNTGITAGADGRKIVKAGTPLTGSLEARGTAFAKASTTEGVSNAVGVLLHDVDVTAGAENGTLLIFGFVDLNKVDTTTAALITSDVKTALKGGVTFLK